MSKIVDQIISGVVKGAMAEILKKTGARTTKRTRRKTRSSKSLGDGIVGSILKAALGGKKTKPVRAPAKKQVSRRKTAASRSKKRLG